MKKSTLLTAAAALLLAASPVLAEDDAELHAAQRDLQSARGHLRSATHDYDGHRKEALESTERALDHVQEGLKVATHRDKRDDRKVQDLEHKQQKIEKQINKLNE